MPNPVNQLLRQAKLPTILIIPFVLQMLGTVGLVGYLSFRNGQNAVNALAGELQQETKARIEQNLDHYLALPVQIIVESDVSAYQWGMLRLDDFTVFTQEQNIVVASEDSGRGIPLKLQGQIFEPFFTTKPPGEGSGLGLSIVRKIIDKRQPGCTVFRVMLPILT